MHQVSKTLTTELAVSSQSIEDYPMSQETTTHKAITLYTNRYTRLFNLDATSEAFDGGFLFELTTKKGIYAVGATFSMNISFVAPRDVFAADAASRVTTNMKTVYKSDGLSSKQEVVEYEFSESEQALVNEAIIKALQSFPEIPAIVRIDNAQATPKSAKDTADDAQDDESNQKFVIFVDDLTDQDRIERYDDSSEGELTLKIDNRYECPLDFEAKIEEEYTPAKWSDGVCVRQRVERLIGIEITELLLANEVRHKTYKDVIDTANDDAVVDYEFDDEARELIKQLLIETIKATPKS